MMVRALLLAAIILQAHRCCTADESQCKFVSSRGILKSTSVHASSPISSTTIIDADLIYRIVNGSTVYVSTSALKAFAARAHEIVVPYVLVSGDSDWVISDSHIDEKGLRSLLNSALMLHWFAQNKALNHSKLSGIPIGLDYHSVAAGHWWAPRSNPLEQEQLLLSIAKNAPPLQKRVRLAFSSSMSTANRGGRQGIAKALSNASDAVFYQPAPWPRRNVWNMMSHFAFIISPPGAGPDCHRTWEALALGCIPIVETHPMNADLFDGLPVLVVNEWREVTRALLDRTVLKFSQRSFNMEKLQLRWWVDRMNSYK
jgi:hypothetical protein